NPAPRFEVEAGRRTSTARGFAECFFPGAVALAAGAISLPQGWSFLLHVLNRLFDRIAFSLNSHRFVSERAGDAKSFCRAAAVVLQVEIVAVILNDIVRILQKMSRQY